MPGTVLGAGVQLWTRETQSLPSGAYSLGVTDNDNAVLSAKTGGNTQGTGLHLIGRAEGKASRVSKIRFEHWEMTGRFTETMPESTCCFQEIYLWAEQLDREESLGGEKQGPG